MEVDLVTLPVEVQDTSSSPDGDYVMHDEISVEPEPMLAEVNTHLYHTFT